MSTIINTIKLSQKMFSYELISKKILIFSLVLVIISCSKIPKESFDVPNETREYDTAEIMDVGSVSTLNSNRVHPKDALTRLWTVSVDKFDSSSLLVTAIANFSDGEFVVGEQFSNANPYIEPMFGDNLFLNGSVLQGDISKKLQYIVHFPIFWSASVPYGMMNDSFGVVPSSFFLPRRNSGDAMYELNFGEFGMEVDNSEFGPEDKYLVSSNRLFETYFLFGRIFTLCQLRNDEYHIDVISNGPVNDAETICKNVESLADYYVRSFGVPPKMHSPYRIGIFPARDFSSLGSGFYYPRMDYRHVAHEMFHVWQPHEYPCDDHFLVYREGLATYMQWRAQYEAGIITNDAYSSEFGKSLEKVKTLSPQAIMGRHDETVSVRKEKPEEYSTLIYDRGGLVWKMMEDDALSPSREFKAYLREGNCTKLARTVSEYDEKLTESIHASNDTKTPS